MISQLGDEGGIVDFWLPWWWPSLELLASSIPTMSWSTCTWNEFSCKLRWMKYMYHKTTPPLYWAHLAPAHEPVYVVNVATSFSSTSKIQSTVLRWMQCHGRKHFESQVVWFSQTWLAHWTRKPIVDYDTALHKAHSHDTLRQCALN